ncbi:MAG: hypothetical protein AVDCRST_MAG17-46 [uncultured Solirubrobacterales bacterium]|uniref:Calcineurin-like phosphoesterase domain-containing protein n=1 Tax=uncultured Solirubrobacterales bacterium TaxID=768556 RepID=A0A6J4RW88_9ACTN|nr:MAG: hypothetical protein AVDCRST_MAG17-46 [uncultured Solirubrobacterales bacterium]
MTATRPVAMLLVVLVAAVFAGPAIAAPFTTVERTIEDRDGDDLLEYAPGEDHTGASNLPAARNECEDRREPGFQLPRSCSIFHFLQLSDFQMVDEESPGRVEFFDTTQRGPFNPFSSAYRPQESLTTQVTESMVRQARNSVSPVTANPLELTLLTGDNADSQQFNETRWFIDILDGTAGPGNPDPEAQSDPSAQDRKIEPDSGIPRDVEPGEGLPPGACDATPGSIYDGVRNNGTAGPGDPGPAYYEPDATRPGKDDGDGYSPNPARNFSEVGRRVTVRDFPGLLEDANEPFEAIGLDMPWYSAFGNHDALVQGNDPNAYFGPGGPFDPTPNAAKETSNPVFQAVATGCVKPTSAAAVTGIENFSQQAKNLVESSAPPEDVDAVVEAARTFLAQQAAAGGATLVPPDRRRCYLAKDEPKIGAPDPCTVSWIDQHSKTTGTPVGHGFRERPPEAELNNDGYYSFSPKPGLRLIALDTVTDECGGEFCSEGSIDDTQFEWLRRELESAAAAGQYAIAYGHHTLRTLRQPNTDPTESPVHYGQRADREDPNNPQNPSPSETLEELFCLNPNVLAYVAGHEHENVVERHECVKEDKPPPTPGPGDFVEVGTAAHIDFPQQSRMIELVDAGGEIAMVLTMLDHDGPANPGGPPPRCSTERGSDGRDGCGEAGEEPTRLSSIARELTFNDYQHSRSGARGGRDDRNIVVPLGRPFPCPSGPGDPCDPSVSDPPPSGG